MSLSRGGWINFGKFGILQICVGVDRRLQREPRTAPGFIDRSDERNFTDVARCRPGLATSRPKPAYGLQHLLQFGARPKCRGWPNRRELRVIERSFFWATHTPLASAKTSHRNLAERVEYARHLWQDQGTRGIKIAISYQFSHSQQPMSGNWKRPITPGNTPIARNAFLSQVQRH